MRAYVTSPERGARVVGVEIMPQAVSVSTLPFTGPTAFLLGNEGSGLSPAQCAICDAFVYIPQHGPGTASLNVAVAAGIVLHRFADWARYPEASRDAGDTTKFCVAERPQRTHARGIVPELSAEEVRAARAARAAAAAADGDGALLPDWGVDDAEGDEHADARLTHAV